MKGYGVFIGDIEKVKFQLQLNFLQVYFKK